MATKLSFDEIIDKLRSTPKGKEASMYGPIRDLFIHFLGYPVSDVDIDTSGEGGRPDVTVRASSGMLDAKGRPHKIEWIVVEAKDEHNCFVDTTSREIIFEKKAKYIGSNTAWFIMVEPNAWIMRPVAGSKLTPDADIEIMLDQCGEQEFKRKAEPLSFDKAGVSPLMKKFREGDSSSIAVEKLMAMEGQAHTPSKRQENRIRLNRNRFFQQIRETTIFLQAGVTVALSRINPDIEKYKAAGEEFWAAYGRNSKDFDHHSLTIQGRPQGREQSQRHDRESARLRRVFAKSPHIARLALRGLPDFQARTGIDDEKLSELFAIETANLILARVLLLRFLEDHGFFGDMRYICNGGVAAFQNMRMYFKASYAKLLEQAYHEGCRLYASAFDETELDWIFGIGDETLSCAIEWALFQFAKYDFTTIKGDILNGIYDRFMDRAQRKKMGEFYTPPSIARYIIRRLRVNRENRILDPACGSGTFLIESYREMAGNDVDRGAAEYSDAIAALEHIAGNDLNTFSAVLSQIQLLWHILGFKKEIEAQGFPDILVTAKVNSLVEQDQWTSMDRFAELDQPEYDAVIGNPPYVRAERSAQALDKRSQYEFERGRDGFPGISSKLNSYALFLYRALDRWCKPADPDGHAGKVGFVLPVSLFDSNDTAPLRKLFAIGGRWAIREIVDLEVIYRQVFDADVLPAILIAENCPPNQDDIVSVRFADHSCVISKDNLSLREFDLESLEEFKIAYKDMFSPDGRILTRLTSRRLSILHKLWANGTFLDIAKPYWVRKDGSRIVEWTDKEPEDNGNKQWEPRKMLARGITFRRTKAQCKGGMAVYKGENIIATALQGDPSLDNADMNKIDDISMWKYSDILPKKGLAVARVAHCPNGLMFDPSKVVFTDTATILLPRENYAEVPLDLILMSNVYVWFYAIAARMGILRTFRSDIYPTNLALLPWNDKMSARSGEIESMRTNLVTACTRRLAGKEVLRESLKGLNLKTVKQRLGEDLDARISWGDNFSDPKYEAVIGEVSVAQTEEGWQVNLACDLFDFVACNRQDIAGGLVAALRQEEGSELTKSAILNTPVPVTESELNEWNKIVDEHKKVDLEAEMQDAIHRLDKVVGNCLGLTEEDVHEIQRDLKADPFLKAIRPRYPGTVTRKQGFRTGLDSDKRYS